MIANEVDKLPKGEQSEHDIQNKIIKMCRDRGALVWRINSGGTISRRGGHITQQKKGTADTFILYRGVFIAAEIKKPGEKATDEQIAFLESVANEGGVGLLAYDVDFVEEILNNIRVSSTPLRLLSNLQWGSKFPNRVFVEANKWQKNLASCL